MALWAGRGGREGNLAYFPIIKVMFMPYSSDFHSFKICFMLVLLNCPTSKITIFSFYTKSLQDKDNTHLNLFIKYCNKPLSRFSMGLHMYFYL